MGQIASAERQELADLMLEVGRDAPTLCAGWSVGDLLAHLVLRERRPAAAAGILVAPLAAYTARVQSALRDGHSFPELVSLFRSGPPRFLRPVDDSVNTVELFVHHEDVRRAGALRVPRTLDLAEERMLWSRLRWLSLRARRRVPGGVTLAAPGFGRYTVRPGSPLVTVTGRPGELVLFMTGRQDAAEVEVEGPAEACGALRHALLAL